ncbi:MAG: hypothetical protein M1818_003229 [Claussenomyces sp. TS43310]|nr:MAG: hypothetical protein M1818_003229 [Claussenomyces sp. TS43310]
MALILPKGIVVNSPQISGDIQRIAKEPLKSEELAKLWKVYTTTRRRLRDPTAERLENHWWRIWGSQKRSLDGATVARLFTEISDGQSFVPLRSPLKRDESGSPSGFFLRNGDTTSSSSKIHTSRQRDDTPKWSKYATGMAPMPPPILKKVRGPSTSGPRPTARFVSPYGSKDEPSAGGSSSVLKPPRVAIHAPVQERQEDIARSVENAKNIRGTLSPSDRHRSGCSQELTLQSSPAGKLNFGNEHISGVSIQPPQSQAQMTGTSRPQSRFQEHFSSPEERQIVRGPHQAPSGKGDDSSPHDLAPMVNVAFNSIASDDTTRSSPINKPCSPRVSSHLKNSRHELPEADDRLGEECKDLGYKIDHFSAVENSNAAPRAADVCPSNAPRHDGRTVVQKGRSKHEVQMPAMHDLSIVSDSRISPHRAVALGQCSPKHLQQTTFDSGCADVNGMKSNAVANAGQTHLFAKRPVPSSQETSVPSIMADSVKTALSSKNSISQSISQLTFLLEKDREQTERLGRSGSSPKDFARN